MHLHLDCQFGMAGDMLLAALIDAGADREAILAILRSTSLGDFEVEVERTTRGGVSATLLDVVDTSIVMREGHTHDHSHEHYGDPHSRPHDHEHSHEHPHQRAEEHYGDPHSRLHDHDHARGHNHEHPHQHAEEHYGDPHSRLQDHDHGHDHSRSHEHQHQHVEEHYGDPHSRPHDPENSHKHDHGHDHGKTDHGPHRHLEDLLSLLECETISPRVRERASRIFHIMAQAEATVHGQTVDTVHFHEISGIDTAVDVIGSCIALELLDVDSISASAPSVGSGMLMCEHGIFPVPAPATLEILKSHNIPWRAGGEGERATPTGMALLAGLAESFGDSPQITVTRIGYGAGHREFDDVPNLLRVIIGKPGAPGESERPGGGKTIIAEPEQEVSGEIVRVALDEAMLPAAVTAMLPGDVAADGDRVVEFRFVVDDMTPENIAYLCERCLAVGAIEAYAVAAIMKKGRPGHEVTVLATTESAPVVANVLWRESSTFGMRVGERSRLILARDYRTVLVLGHEVRVKLGWLGGTLVRCQPEYEDCRKVALDSGRPLAEVYGLVERAADTFGKSQ